MPALDAKATDKRWTKLRFSGDPDCAEVVYRYRPGGYHPIHLDDTLDQGRYRVVHKLGYGGFSTVWLCRDTSYNRPRYVAVKVLVANQDEDSCRELLMGRHLRALCLKKQPAGDHICLPLRDFHQQGPNGTHICIVYPVLGPHLGCAMEVFADMDDCAGTVRRLLKQVATTLSLLHENGICHGDLRPRNVLLGLKSLDGLDTSEVYDILGEPEKDEVIMLGRPAGTALDPDLPQYLVYPVDAADIEQSHLLTQIYITDFGESFNYHESSRLTGIPRAYCAPEAVLDKSTGPASDLWALGCLLFETRLCTKIIQPGDMLGPCDQEYILEITLLLGRLPEPWWGDWAKRHKFFKPDEEQNTHDPLEKQPGKGANYRPGGLKEPRSIKEKIEVSCHERMLDGDLVKHQGVSTAEVDSMADLLGRLLRYNPEERIRSRDAAHHEWFRM